MAAPVGPTQGDQNHRAHPKDERVCHDIGDSNEIAGDAEGEGESKEHETRCAALIRLCRESGCMVPFAQVEIE